MTTLVEGRHPGGFLVWEVLRDYTRETVTIVSGAGKLAPGTVLGRITIGGKLTRLAPDATDGSETAAGLLWGEVDATSADAPAVVLVRGPAIANRHEITFPEGATAPEIAAAIADLAVLGILVR